MTVTLHFHGATGTVTGSCYRVDHPGGHFLVDCGLFQGNRTVRTLNLKPTPFDPKSIDFLLLTHAHTDHVGLLSKLYAQGWRGPAWMTEPTAGLLEYTLPDSVGIQESEAEQASRKRGGRGEEPVESLYTARDAEEALRHRQTCAYERWIEPGPGVRAIGMPVASSARPPSKSR
ncbi:MAG: MBL fold metallo-hydrolase [Candidatus Devosia euplotis]|nr:MBL fold metallo-hydrolase [Candidatus Devosia euplotis]